MKYNYKTKDVLVGEHTEPIMLKDTMIYSQQTKSWSNVIKKI